MDSKTTESTFQSFEKLREVMNQRIVGQSLLNDRLLMALLADGHMLVEGAPGLAKTTAIKVLTEHIDGEFHRIQFTPDLLPSDLTGTEIYRPQEHRFEFQQGPMFHNLLLADEVNRAPAKVQSALLEAMGERQVTVGRVTYPLPELFLVMATQNPIEQEGTYPLPEAQLDRFLLHVRIGYPDAGSEKLILELARSAARGDAKSNAKGMTPIPQEQIFAARKEIIDLYMAPNLEEYLIALVLASRNPQPWGEDLARWIAFGVSPRGSIGLDRCARAHAWLDGRDYVSPGDIQAVAPDVLRHRLLVSYEAQAEGIDSDHIINELIARVPVP